MCEVNTCEICGNEATVHEVTIEGGVPIEKHLCESCAREAGLVVPGPVPLEDIIKQITQPDSSVTEIEIHAVGPVGPNPSAAQTASQRQGDMGGQQVCKSCGLTFAAFRKNGKLGCSSCYSAFEPQLRSILDRAHEGATHHVGKVPRRTMGGLTDKDNNQARELALLQIRARTEAINRVRNELARAVAEEKYEDAARLRDRLIELQRGRDSTTSLEKEKTDDPQGSGGTP